MAKKKKSEFELLYAEREKQTKEFKKKATKLFKEEMKRLFALCPELEAVKWDQYAPYFNDGDACTFHVHEMQFKYKFEITPKLEEEYYFYDEFTESIITEDKNVREAMNELSNLIMGDEMEEVMKDMFGDNSEIEFDGKSFSVSDAEHD